MENTMTGERRFFNYAWPCGRIRLMSNKITLAHYAELKRLAESNDPPSQELLALCFPDAVKAYREFLERSHQEPWTFESVGMYWRHYHTHPGEHAESPLIPDVFVADIESINDNGHGLEIQIGSVKTLARNLYDLVLQTGDRVFIHKGVIIEKA